MGSCIGKQGSEIGSSSKYNSPRRSSKVEEAEKQPSLEEAINRIEKNKESIENELEGLKQQLQETK